MKRVHFFRRWLYLVSFGVIIAGSVSGQSHTKDSLSYRPFGANLQVRNIYLWRGFRVSDAPIIDVDIHYRSKNGHFQAGFWGGGSFTGHYKEFDYYLSYSRKGFTVTLVDINNFSDFPNASIFDYDPATTSHFVDLSVAYRIPFNYPLNVSWSTILAGRDVLREGKGASDKPIPDAHGNVPVRYSHYVQLEQYVWQHTRGNVRLVVGGAFAFGRQDHFYGDRPNVVHLGCTLTHTFTIFKTHDIQCDFTAMFNPEKKYGGLQMIVNVF